MKTMILMALLMQPMGAAAGAIPSPEVQSFANKLSFLAAIARRCDSALVVKGRAALGTGDCAEFERKLVPVMDEALRLYDQLRADAEAAERATSPGAKHAWTVFWNDVQAHLAAVEKTREHLKFLREP